MDSAVIQPYARSPVPASRAPRRGLVMLPSQVGATPAPSRGSGSDLSTSPVLPDSPEEWRMRAHDTSRTGKAVIPMLSTILVPLDGSPLAEHALPHAKRLPEAASARLVLTRVLPLPVFQSAENDLASTEE